MLCPKVDLRDLFRTPDYDRSARNRIDRKHVDFVLADLETLQPVCGIELDDRLHLQPDRQARDRFVEVVFATAGLPLLRVPVQRSYDTASIAAQLYSALEQAPRGATNGRTASYAATPECPKCRIPMVRRSTKSGRQFFGCTNFPRCIEAA